MTQQILDTKVATPVYELAVQSHREGWSVFTCSVQVGLCSTAVLVRSTSSDLGPLIHAIEAIGWRLDRLDHVPIPQNGADSRTFAIRAQMLFRRTDESTTD